MKKVLVPLAALSIVGCAQMQGLMDKLSGKLTPEGEKVALVYAETGNEFIDYSFNLKRLPSEFKSCKLVQKEVPLPFRGGVSEYEKMTTMIENVLRNEAGKIKGADTVVPVKRDVMQEGEILSGTVTGRAYNCPEKIRKCRMLGNCSYENTAYPYVTRKWAPLKGKQMGTQDRNLAFTMRVRDDSLVLFFTMKNKIGKPIKIDSGKIVAHGAYGRDRNLTIMGDREIDPKDNAQLSAGMNLTRTLPVCGSSSGRMLGGRAVTSVDDKFCVGEKFTLELKYRIGNGSRQKISFPFKLVGRVADKS
jgi:hypothetical protein